MGYHPRPNKAERDRRDRAYTELAKEIVADREWSELCTLLDRLVFKPPGQMYCLRQHKRLKLTAAPPAGRGDAILVDVYFRKILRREILLDMLTNERHNDKELREPY